VQKFNEAEAELKWQFSDATCRWEEPIFTVTKSRSRSLDILHRWEGLVYTCLLVFHCNFISILLRLRRASDILLN